MDSCSQENHSESSRSLIETFSVLPSDQNLIEGFVLGHWNHIVGPRPLYLWRKPKLETTHQSIQPSVEDINHSCFDMMTAVKYAVGHSLVAGSQLNHDGVMEGLIQDKFFIVENANLVCCAITFHVAADGTHEAYCLALLADFVNYGTFIKLLDFCGKWLKRIGAKLRISLLKDCKDEVLNCVGNELCGLCSAVIKLFKAPICKAPLDNCMHFIADREFFESVLTSHLQTCGNTIVVGESSSSVDSMLNWLSRFLTNDEIFLSHYAYSNKYTPGFYLQGIADSEGIHNISALDLLYAQYPTTIVDLTHLKVRQGLPIQAHQRARNETLLYELYSLWKGKPSSFKVTESIMVPVNSRSNWVKKLMKDLLKLPLNRWDHVIILFIRQLYYKASSMVECVKAAVKNYASISKKSLLEEITKLLKVDETDLRILLAFAEKYNPGISEAIYNGIDCNSK